MHWSGGILSVQVHPSWTSVSSPNDCNLSIIGRINALLCQVIALRRHFIDFIVAGRWAKIGTDDFAIV